MAFIDLIDTQQRFSKEMQERLCEKQEEGFSGWDDPKYVNAFRHQLFNCVQTGKYVDAANFAMMLRRFECIGYIEPGTCDHKTFISHGCSVYKLQGEDGDNLNYRRYDNDEGRSV